MRVHDTNTGRTEAFAAIDVYFLENHLYWAKMIA
jgi:hypothetical protein